MQITRIKNLMFGMFLIPLIAVGQPEKSRDLRFCELLISNKEALLDNMETVLRGGQVVTADPNPQSVNPSDVSSCLSYFAFDLEKADFASALPKIEIVTEDGIKHTNDSPVPVLAMMRPETRAGENDALVEIVSGFSKNEDSSTMSVPQGRATAGSAAAELWPEVVNTLRKKIIEYSSVNSTSLR